MAAPARAHGESPIGATSARLVADGRAAAPVMNDAACSSIHEREGVGRRFLAEKHRRAVVIQECRRMWAKQGCEFTWERLLG
jgi:hypothetical protein